MILTFFSILCIILSIKNRNWKKKKLVKVDVILTTCFDMGFRLRPTRSESLTRESVDSVRGRAVDSGDTLEQVHVLGLVADSVDSQNGLMVRLMPSGGATRNLRGSGLRTEVCLTGCGRIVGRGSRLRLRNESRPSCEARTVPRSNGHWVKECRPGGRHSNVLAD